MALDRLIALIILIIAVIYGIAAYNYPLLPFERNLPVLPNTLPKGLAFIAAALAIFVLLAPRPSNAETDTNEPSGPLQIVPVAALVLAMIAYALLLRPVGFLIATSAFIILTAVGLGERRWTILVPVALLATGLVWALVQQVLGIFLSPWPAALS